MECISGFFDFCPTDRILILLSFVSFIIVGWLLRDIYGGKK